MSNQLSNANIDIDLKSYDVIVRQSTGGYCNFSNDEDFFYVFYGVPGEDYDLNTADNTKKQKEPEGNIFYYFKVPLKSKAGMIYSRHQRNVSLTEKLVSESPVDRLKYQNMIFVSRDRLIKACKSDAVEEKKGADAYFMYWNSLLQKTEKIGYAFQIVYCFEALKDWYTVNLEYFINENEHNFINEAVRESEIEQWRENLANEVRTFLISNKKNPATGRSSISKFHANELIQFHDWLLSAKTDTKELMLDEVITTISAEFDTEINPAAATSDNLESFGEFLKTDSIKDRLREKYRGKKPKPIMMLVFALHELGELKTEVLLLGQSELLKSLELFFGQIGSPQQIGTHLRAYEDEIKRKSYKNSINTAKEIIKSILPNHA